MTNFHCIFKESHCIINIIIWFQYLAPTYTTFIFVDSRCGCDADNWTGSSRDGGIRGLAAGRTYELTVKLNPMWINSLRCSRKKFRYWKIGVE